MREFSTFSHSSSRGGIEWFFLIIFFVFVLLIGAALAIQPLLVAPVILITIVLGIFALALWIARRSLVSKGSWQPYALVAFWVLVINVPTFLSFDQTGFTHSHGLFNAQSLSRILVLCFGVVAALAFWIIQGRETAPSKSGSTTVPGIWPLLALYLWYAAMAPLVSVDGALSAAALAVFRSIEWLVALFILTLIFSFQARCGKYQVKDRLRLLMPMLWFIICTVLLLLVVSPGHAYQVSAITGLGRLGSMFAHPNLLAIVLIIALAYATAFMSGWLRLLFIAGGLVMLALTYSRGGFAAMVGVAAVGIMLLIRSIVMRVLVSLTTAVAIVLVLQVPQVQYEANRILSRGNESEGLSTLSERTAVWGAAKIMIARSPILGEGFISGPKELGEIMYSNRFSRNFAAPHAHNEWLQAQISGGVVALLLSLGIHLRSIYLLIRCSSVLGRRELFVLAAVLISVLSWSVLTPSLSYFLSLPGIILAWLVLTLESIWRGRRLGEQSLGRIQE